jgi:hypothetical protein
MRLGDCEVGGRLVQAPRGNFRRARTTASSERPCMVAVRAALRKHVVEPMWQTRTV